MKINQQECVQVITIFWMLFRRKMVFLIFKDIQTLKWKFICFKSWKQLWTTVWTMLCPINHNNIVLEFDKITVLLPAAAHVLIFQIYFHHLSSLSHFSPKMENRLVKNNFYMQVKLSVCRCVQGNLKFVTQGTVGQTNSIELLFCKSHKKMGNSFCCLTAAV